MGEFGRFASEDDARASVEDKTRKMTPQERGQVDFGGHRIEGHAAMFNRIPGTAEERAAHAERVAEGDRIKVKEVASGIRENFPSAGEAVGEGKRPANYGEPYVGMNAAFGESKEEFEANFNRANAKKEGTAIVDMSKLKPPEKGLLDRVTDGIKGIFSKKK